MESYRIYIFPLDSVTQQNWDLSMLLYVSSLWIHITYAYALLLSRSPLHNITSLFIFLSVDEPLGRFQFLAITNKLLKPCIYKSSYGCVFPRWVNTQEWVEQLGLILPYFKIFISPWYLQSPKTAYDLLFAILFVCFLPSLPGRWYFCKVEHKCISHATCLL